jgi:putative transposase
MMVAFPGRRLYAKMLAVGETSIASVVHGRGTLDRPRASFARPSLADGGDLAFGFHYAVQPDHLHLVVEAQHRKALTAGARGLSVRVARLLNRARGRSGKVFADRFHARPLRTPREVRRALAYVLLQERRHAAKRRSATSTTRDPYSSAPAFDGFTRGSPRAGPWDGTFAPPETSLLAVGWLRHGKIDPREVPGSSS